MPEAPQTILNRVHYFHTHSGVLAGTLGLVVLWLILTLLEKYGKRFGAVIARAIKRPVMLGFGLALYLGWAWNLLGELVEQEAQIKIPLESSVMSTSVIVIALGWATINLGRTLILHSKRITKWISVEDPRDQVMLTALLDRIFTIGVVVLTLLALMITFGVSTTALGALLGGAGIGIGFGAQQISQNFLSGFMLFFNRPFSEGDWISVSDMEGTVEQIGWYHTRIRTFDRRPQYIPNSLFATTPILNPGRMYNRRIKANISLRYEDLSRIDTISKDVRTMLLQHPSIDQSQTILVNFHEWDSSSINMLVYCFTKTTVWKEWLDIQQQIFLEIADIVKHAGGDFAFDCMTLYQSPGDEQGDKIQLMREQRNLSASGGQMDVQL